MPAQEKVQTETKKESKDIAERTHGPVKIEPEKTLIEWVSPARPFKRRDREFWVTIIAIAAVVGLIIFVIEGSIMPILLIISLVFLFYILATVEPENIDYTITNYGIKIAEKRTDWELIRRFWFSRRFNDQLLILETFTLPGRLELVVNEKEIDKIKKMLKDYIIEEEAPPSYLDKTANWFTKKLPQ